MATDDPNPTLTPLPSYMGRPAFLVGQTRPVGTPPVLTEATEAIPENEPKKWRPYSDEEDGTS